MPPLPTPALRDGQGAPLFLAAPLAVVRLLALPSLSRSGCHRAAGSRVRASLPGLDFMGVLHAALERAQAALYTLADAAVGAGTRGAGAAAGDVERAVQKSGGWFGFISDAMEVVLKK